MTALRSIRSAARAAIRSWGDRPALPHDRAFKQLGTRRGHHVRATDHRASIAKSGLRKATAVTPPFKATGTTGRRRKQAPARAESSGGLPQATAVTVASRVA